MPDLGPYVGRWVAIVYGHIVGVGSSADQALHMAKRNRPKEEPQLLFVSPDVQAAVAVEHYPLIEQVFDLVSDRGVPVYLVGGSVRDLILGTETHDLDFVVAGDGLAVARHVANQLRGAYMSLDQERMTGRVFLRPRIGAGGSRDAADELTLDIASLRGDQLSADLQDRDFTINAMALERTAEGHWHLIDPLGGCEDLQSRTLRAASPSSFARDPVRTLRAVRMHAQFGCAIESETRRWLESAVPLLVQVSAERVRDEWFKILQLPEAPDALRELYQLGLLWHIAPPAARLEGLEQPFPHQFDALTHSFETVRAIGQLWAALQEQETDLWASLPDSLRPIVPQIRQRYKSPLCDQRSRLSLLQCAAFLHDVGKPETRGVDEHGRVQFIGHEKKSAEIAAGLGQQWRCSGAEIAMLRTAIGAHMRPTWLSAQSILSRRAIHRYFRDTGEHGVDAAFVALADLVATWGTSLPAERWKQQVETVTQLWRAYYGEQATIIAPPPLITGRDLIGGLDLSPGPEIGLLLRRVREAQAAGEIHTRAEAMAYAQDRLARSHHCRDPEGRGPSNANA